MKISLRFFLIYSFVSLFIFACTSDNSSSKESALSQNTNTSLEDLAYFVQQTKEVESGTEIPLSLCEQLIQPALSNQSLHPYLGLDQATYSYGQILHENAEMIAFTFYYKATQGRNLLAGSFMASFNAVTQEFIDCKMVFGSSTFNFQTTKGYNLGFSCKSDLEFIESDDLVLILKSKIKHFYSAFREGVAPKANSITTQRYTLLTNGQFVFG